MRGRFSDPSLADRFPAIAPELPFVVVGDVHGRADLLNKILEEIGDLPTVFVGDYVNRGPDSAEVLSTLAGRPDVTCLLGNHEEMLLDFLDDPLGKGRRFLRHGGIETLLSFGIELPEQVSEDAALHWARDTLFEAMGADLIDWLVTRPVLWQSGNVAVVHAGADPLVPMEEQKRSSLIWGHPDFHRRARADGIWVVHGHKIVPQPTIQDGRISIDTGAYASGRLTGVRLENGDAFAQTVTV